MSEIDTAAMRELAEDSRYYRWEDVVELCDALDEARAARDELQKAWRIEGLRHLGTMEESLEWQIRAEEAEATIERVRVLTDFWDSDLDMIPAKRVRAALDGAS